MRLVVTGGAGFIGSHLTERLVREGHEVRVLDLFTTGTEANLAPVAGKVTVFKGDIRDPKIAAQAFEGSHAVFHLAAMGSVARSVENPENSNSVNVDGTLAMLVAARGAGVKRFIYASSSSVYGDTPTLPKHEEMPTAPTSPYGVSKLAAELYCRVFWGVYGLETISLRYFNVFGPRQDPKSQYAAVIPRFTESLLEGRKPSVFGDGEQTRDFTYVENVVEANVLALRANKGFGEAMNVAGGGRVSLNELIKKLQGLTGKATGASYGPGRPGDIRDSYAAIEKARDLIGFVPVETFEGGLKKTVQWYRTQGRAVA